MRLERRRSDGPADSNSSPPPITRCDLERQRKLARAERHSFTVQCRRLVASTCTCTASGLISATCVLFIMACTFAVAVGPFLWFRHGSGFEDTSGLRLFDIPTSHVRDLHVNRSLFEENAVTIVVGVRTALPSREFLAALMEIDPDENIEVIFVMGNPSSTVDSLADRLVETRHRFFDVTEVTGASPTRLAASSGSHKNPSLDANTNPADAGGDDVADIDARIDDAAIADELGAGAKDKINGGADDGDGNNGGAVGQPVNNRRVAAAGGGDAAERAAHGQRRRGRRGDSGPAAGQVGGDLDDDDHAADDNDNDNDAERRRRQQRRPVHPAMISPRMLLAKPAAASEAKHGKLAMVSLGQLFDDGADAARPESKYLLFLSSFSRVLRPRAFVSQLLRDMREEAPCDSFALNEGVNVSDMIALGRPLFNDERAAGPGGGGGDVDDERERRRHLDKFGHFMPRAESALRRRIVPSDRRNGKRRGVAGGAGLGGAGAGAGAGARNGNNNNGGGGGDARDVCRFGAIQCLMLEPSSSSDIQRSSPHVIADAGWTVDLGTASTDPHRFLDDTIFLANREAGTPPNAGRLRRGAAPWPVDAISPSCFMVDRAALYDVGAFDGVRGFPTNVDITLSGRRLPHVERREHALSALYDSIAAVESAMEHMSMDEVRLPLNFGDG